MPAGNPAALESAAAELGRYASRIGDLAAATHRSTAGAVTDGDWTGGAADAYTAYTGGLVSGIGGMEQPLSRIPHAVSGYAAALRTAQSKVGAYQAYADQVNRIQGPVSATEAATIKTQSQQLETDARHALEGLDAAKKEAASALKAIGESLDQVFGKDGTFRKWLETIARPWDGAAGDAFLEALLKKGETAEEAFKEGEKAAEEGKNFLKELPGKLEDEWHNILDDSIQELLNGNADGPTATARFMQLQDAVETFSADIGEAPAKSGLLRALPGLRVFGGVTSAAGLIGGLYTAIAPPEYDHGAMRTAARVAGGAAAVGGGIGLGSSLGLIGGDTIATVAGASLTVPGIGEAVGVGAGLYLTGDYIYHHTHQIAHAFDVARHTVAHYADDVGGGIASAAKTVGHGIASGAGTVEHGISSGLSDVTGGLL